ncbi:MFS transporter [soil metagenome]
MTAQSLLLLKRLFIMTYLQKRLILFSNPAFSMFFISAICTTFGDGLLYIIVTWLVLKAYGSVSSIAILMLCFWLPKVVFGPWCGVLADRHSRKDLVVISNTLRTLFTLSLTFLLFWHFSVYILYVLAVSMGICWGLYTPASMALVCELVASKDLLYANATMDTAYELGNIVGMGIAGLALALISPQLALVFAGILFLFSALTAWRISPPINIIPKDPTLIQPHWLSDLQEGLKYLLRHRTLMLLCLIQLLIMVEYMTTPVLLAPFATQILHATAGQFGLIEVGLSIGLVLGGVISPYLAEKYGAFWIIALEMLLLGICFWFFSLNDKLWLAVVLYGVMGFCFSTWPLVLTEAQRLTEMRFQGRVQSTFNSLSGLSIVSVYLTIHFIGNNIPIQGLYWLEIFFALISLLLFLSQQKHWRKMYSPL